MNAQVPAEVLRLQQALLAVPGLVDVALGNADASSIRHGDFMLPIYGDMPLATLGRTGGGLADEMLVYARFAIERDERGLRALEFVSWWVRDCARSGEPLQIRSLGLPPLPEQFGDTLCFVIELFHVDPEQSMPALLQRLDSLASSLASAVQMYGGVLED
ncbi:hypothetical protein [Xanthomonas sp.]|uniref:hypothetical protein n=1 Tax=Xanthomonas sp. TaxID=29446 RepID=UPI0031BB34C7